MQELTQEDLNNEEIIDISTLSQVHQHKYTGNFQANLEASQELVNIIIGDLRNHGLLARAEDDKNPFKDMYGNAVRLWDIMVVDPIHFSTCYFEAKDHARCVYYNVTGLPQRYIDQKMMFANKGKDMYLVFRDNMEWISEKSKAYGKSTEYLIDELVENGFAEKREDKIFFVPYGNNLSFLMDPENQRKELEPRIKSQLSRYRGEAQYLWKISAMKPIKILIETVFGKDMK